MTHTKLTADDIQLLRECWLVEVREDDPLIHGPKVVMTSLGYVEPWSAGGGTFAPSRFGSFDFDGDWPDEPGADSSDNGKE